VVDVLLSPTGGYEAGYKMSALGERHRQASDHFAGADKMIGEGLG
jgi:hypothetical protein